MTSGFIPEFNFQQCVVEPWTTNFASTLPVVLMGFFVAAACGLVGSFLLLRRLALIGDAISHSILPGLALAFVVFKSVSIWASMIGAVGAALATVAVIEFIHKHSRVKADAAICIVFTTFFALGVALITALESRGGIHLDAECVLYGELALVSLEPSVSWLGLDLGPASVLRMGLMLLVVVGVIAWFYKELVITSFDPALAATLGMKTWVWHYGLMATLALVVVCAFEAVGAILAVAMLIVPPMFAAQLAPSLRRRLGLVVVHAAVSSVVGLHLAVWLNCSTGAAMVVCGSILFVMAWVGTVVRARLHRQRQGESSASALQSPG